MGALVPGRGDGIAGRLDVHRRTQRAAPRGPAAGRERELTASSEVAPEIDVALWETIRSLPKRERELIALRYVARLTEPEIASTLGIAPGTVARGLHDARERLRSMLAPEEDFA